MSQARSKIRTPINLRFAGLFVICVIAFSAILRAQDVKTAESPAITAATDARSDFRVEKVRVAGGAEIVTIFARQESNGSVLERSEEIPVVSILRDTLGDVRPENDRLRYVWMLTYTKASFWQKAAAFVPFLYARTTNKGNVGKEPPPPVADMRRSNRVLWNQILWMVFRRVVLGELGMGARASVSQYHQNVADYRRSAVASALTILSLYESVEGERILSDSEMKDIQARLWLTDKAFGWHMQDENLHRVFDKNVALTRDIRGHNWELLRQYAEAQGLYFEPMEMADETARHALLWVAAEDVAANQGRKFEKRFLNIKNPWTDQKLLNWKGYSEKRWFDDENRVVPEGTPGARSRTMIPLAIYGLDHPKVPIILVDFRNNGNPKMREMTKRALVDVTSNVLAVSRFSGFPYFFGRLLYDFITARRGMDVNQASRLRSYAQLKVLLAMDNELDGEFRDEIAERLEKVSLNPLQNDLATEAKIARAQYRNLMDYASRPDGLPAKLDRERREEMVKFAHSGKERTWFKAANLLTFGLYSHREDATPELVAQMDMRRQLDHHERVLREIAFRSARPEIDTDMDALRRSLTFVAQNGSAAKEKTTRALAKIFAATADEEFRNLCLTGLYQINNSSAKKELLAIYGDARIADSWRVLSAGYLRRALGEGQRISKRDAATIAGITDN